MSKPYVAETKEIEGNICVSLKHYAVFSGAGYFIDPYSMTIWSTKWKKPKKLTGTICKSRNDIRYKLNGDTFFKKEIVKWVNSSMSLWKNSIYQKATVITSTTQENPDSMKKEYFIIARQRTAEALQLFHSHNPIFYGTEEIAKKEAERFAKSEPGVKLIVLKFVGECVAGGVIWK